MTAQLDWDKDNQSLSPYYAGNFIMQYLDCNLLFKRCDLGLKDRFKTKVKLIKHFY